MLAPWKKSYDQPRQHIQKQRHYFTNKGPSSQSYGFSSSHVWMWELNHKEGWGPKNWCLQIMVLEKTLDSALDCKIKPVNLKGNHPWILIGRTDTKAKAPILWPTHWKRPQCWERLKVGGKGDGWRWDGWITSLIQWIWMNKLWEIVKDKGAWGVAVKGVAEPDMI